MRILTPPSRPGACSAVPCRGGSTVTQGSDAAIKESSFFRSMFFALIAEDEPHRRLLIVKSLIMYRVSSRFVILTFTPSLSRPPFKSHEVIVVYHSTTHGTSEQYMPAQSTDPPSLSAAPWLALTLQFRYSIQPPGEIGIVPDRSPSHPGKRYLILTLNGEVPI